jgi:hypothetical protein
VCVCCLTINVAQLLSRNHVAHNYDCVKKVGKRSVDVNSAKLDLLEKKAKYEAEKLKTSEAPEATVNLDALQRAVTKCSNKLASEEQKLADAEKSVNDFVSHFGF